MAPATLNAPLLITAPDRQRLKQTIRTLRGIVGDPYRYYLDALEARIEKAVVVAHDAIPEDVVTMHSVVRIRHGLPLLRQVVMLVHVDEADPAQNKISVVSPLGTALLGARSGESIRWRSRFGERQATVESIPFQPEAAERRASLKEHSHDRVTH